MKKDIAALEDLRKYSSTTAGLEQVKRVQLQETTPYTGAPLPKPDAAKPEEYYFGSVYKNLKKDLDVFFEFVKTHPQFIPLDTFLRNEATNLENEIFDLRKEIGNPASKPDRDIINREHLVAETKIKILSELAATLSNPYTFNELIDEWANEAARLHPTNLQGEHLGEGLELLMDYLQHELSTITPETYTAKQPVESLETLNLETQKIGEFNTPIIPEKDTPISKIALVPTRNAYIEARAAHLKYAGAKKVLGLFGKNKKTSEDLEGKRATYQEQREDYVGGEVARWADEEIALADAAALHALENKEHPTWGEKIYGVYKALGDINLLKGIEAIRGGKEVKGKVKRTILQTLSVRTAIGFGLAGVAGAGLATGATIGSMLTVAGGARALKGGMTGMGVFTGLEARHTSKALKELSDKEIDAIKKDGPALQEKLNEMVGWSEYHHEPITDKPAYQKLQKAYIEYLKTSVSEDADKAKKTDADKSAERKTAIMSELLNDKMRTADEELEKKLKNQTWRREGRKLFAVAAGVAVGSGLLAEAWHKLRGVNGAGAPIENHPGAGGTAPLAPHAEAPIPKPSGWTNVIDNENRVGFHDSSWYSTRQIFLQHTDDLTAQGMGPRAGESVAHWAERMTANAVKHTETGGVKVPSLVHEGDIVHLTPDGTGFKIEVTPNSGYATGELAHHAAAAGAGAEHAPVVPPDGAEFDANGSVMPPDATAGLDYKPVYGPDGKEIVPHVDATPPAPLESTPPHVGTSGQGGAPAATVEAPQIPPASSATEHAIQGLTDPERAEFTALRSSLTTSAPTTDAASFIHFVKGLNNNDSAATQVVLESEVKSADAFKEFIKQARDNTVRILAKTADSLPKTKGESTLMEWHTTSGETRYGYLQNMGSKFLRGARWALDIDGDGKPNTKLLSKEDVIKGSFVITE